MWLSSYKEYSILIFQANTIVTGDKFTENVEKYHSEVGFDLFGKKCSNKKAQDYLSQNGVSTKSKMWKENEVS